MLTTGAPSVRLRPVTTVLVPELDPFQHDTLRFLDHAQGRAILADPMGARKTGSVLAWLASCGTAAHVLVVAPSAVHGHWGRETARFHPSATVLRGTGTRAKRQESLKSALEADGAVVYVTTYESMKADQHAIVLAGFDTVVFDEGHRLKGRRTNVALSANEVCRRARHIIFATGTPVLNHAAELWQYLHILAPKVYPAFWRWAEEHFRIEIKTFRGNRFPTRIIHDFREGHEEIVRNEIAPFFIQRDIADLFPGAAWVVEPEHIEVEVELSPAERKVYKNLVKFKWAVVGDKEITTKNPLDRNTRLMQLTSEWGSLNDDVEDGAKVKAATELVFDLLERDEKVVVFCQYKATVSRLCNALKNKGVRSYTGDLTADQRDEAVQEFVERKDVKVLVGTLGSLSEGADGLQHASNHVVMVDRHWTAAKNDQAIGRLRRSGQLKPVNVYHVFAKETIDATITAACLRKTNVVQMLNGMPLIDAIYGRVA